MHDPHEYTVTLVSQRLWCMRPVFQVPGRQSLLVNIHLFFKISTHALHAQFSHLLPRAINWCLHSIEPYCAIVMPDAQH